MAEDLLRFNVRRGSSRVRLRVIRSGRDGGGVHVVVLGGGLVAAVAVRSRSAGCFGRDRDCGNVGVVGVFTGHRRIDRGGAGRVDRGGYVVRYRDGGGGARGCGDGARGRGRRRAGGRRLMFVDRGRFCGRGLGRRVRTAERYVQLERARAVRLLRGWFGGRSGHDGGRRGLVRRWRGRHRKRSAACLPAVH